MYFNISSVSIHSYDYQRSPTSGIDFVGRVKNYSNFGGDEFTSTIEAHRKSVAFTGRSARCGEREVLQKTILFVVRSSFHDVARFISTLLITVVGSYIPEKSSSGFQIYAADKQTRGAGGF